MRFDVVVAGGGIAGLSAGAAAARLGLRTLVLAGDVLGGNLLSIESVEGYPGYPEGVPGYDRRERVLAERKIEIRFRAEVREIAGDAAVSGVRLASGERLDVAAVFPYIGLEPNTMFLRDAESAHRFLGG